MHVCDCIDIDQLMNEQKTSKSKSAEAVQAQRKYISVYQMYNPVISYIAGSLHWLIFNVTSFKKGILMGCILNFIPV